MGVKVLGRSYTDRNREEPSNWLLGNTGDWQKCVFTFDASIEFLATEQSPVSFDLINNYFVLSNRGNWRDYGFEEGMEITFEYTIETDVANDGEFELKKVIKNDFKIQNIYSHKLSVDSIIDPVGFSQMPLSLGKYRVSKVSFSASSDFEGVKINFTHLKNIDKNSESLNSIIDSSKTELACNSLADADEGQWQDVYKVGLQSGMSIKKARIRSVKSPKEELEASFDIKTQEYDLYTDYSPFSRRRVRNAQSISIRRTYRYGSSGTNSTVFMVDPTYVNMQEPNYFLGFTPGTEFMIERKPTTSGKRYLIVNISISVYKYRNIKDTENKLDLTLLEFDDENRHIRTIVLKTWDIDPSLLNEDLFYSGNTGIETSLNHRYSLIINSNQSSFLNRSTFLRCIINGGSLDVTQESDTLVYASGKRYQLEIEYMISSFLENIQDLKNNKPPTYLLNEGSLTDNIKLKLLPKWNNPNVNIQNVLTETSVLGNTGWFNENYNQLESNFKVDSIDYYSTSGNRVDSLDYVSETKVKVIVSGVKNINSSTKCTIGFAWIPLNEDDYKDKTTSFYNNLFVQSGDTENSFNLGSNYSGPYIGAGLKNGSIDLKDVKISREGDKVVIEGLFSPNVAFSNIFSDKDDEDRNYIIYVSVADSELKNNYSDRVTLLADNNSLIKTIKPAGTYPYIQNSFLEHPENINSLGSEKLTAITQDGILARMPFRLKKNDNTTLNSMTFGIEVFNSSIDKSFVLEDFNVDLSNSVVDANGDQQLSFKSTRGFKLPLGNDKNLVEIKKSDDSSTIDFNGFIAYYAFKIRWEDWIENKDAPAEFFNDNLLNNGKNNDWFDYLSLKGWKINFFCSIDVTKENERLIYKNRWDFNFNDYDSNLLIDTTHNYFKHSDNSNLNVGTDTETGKPLGVILENEETRIEITYRILDSGVFDLSEYYSITTIEIDKGLGIYEERQLSTIVDSESDNPLKSIDGGSRLNYEIDSSKKIITTKCIVDPSLLPDGARYRITGRIGCKKASEPFEQGLYENRYEKTYE